MYENKLFPIKFQLLIMSEMLK